MTYKNTKGGFTIIELLVVISIIGILAVALLVLIGQGRQDARISKASADLRELAQAVTRYQIDHINNFPCASDSEAELAWADDYISAWPRTPWASGGDNWRTAHYNWYSSDDPNTDFNWQIQFTTKSVDVAQELDETLDDGDTSTGLIRSGGAVVNYSKNIEQLAPSECI